MDVIGGSLIAAALTLLIGLELCDLFHVRLPEPLARLHEHGMLGVVLATLLIMAAIVLWVVGPMSSPDPNGRNG